MRIRCILIEVQVTFSSINYSLQVGDTAYYTTWEINNTGFITGTQNLTEFGIVTNISGNIITVEMDDALVSAPTLQDFILFSKDNAANMASILGYYGEVEFKNNSTSKAELFATSCEVSESSK